MGDTVTLNQIIAEVETAKAVVELPSPFAGVVAALHEQPGTVVEVGKPIVSFEVEGDADDAPAVAAPGARRRRQARAEPRRLRRRRSKARPAGPRPPRSARWSQPVRSRGSPRSRAAAPPVAPVETGTPAATRPAERPRSTPPVRKLAKDLGVDLEAVTGTGRARADHP